MPAVFQGVDMIESTNIIRIERPAWFIFSFLSEIEGSPIWEQFEMRAFKITPGEVGPGSEFRLVHRNYERTLRVIEFEKDRLIGAKTVESSAPKVELKFKLQPYENSQTQVSTEWKLDTGTPALVERLVAGKIKSAVAEAIYQLRELLETGSVTLDDGREINMPLE
jgi:hypothetical protein